MVFGGGEAVCSPVIGSHSFFFFFKPYLLERECVYKQRGVAADGEGGSLIRTQSWDPGTMT